jgi:hypothetical protein
LNDSFVGQNVLGLKLFSFIVWNTSPHAILSFKVSIEKYADFDGFAFICYLFFLSYRLQYSFSVLCACWFNNHIPLGGSILVKSVWCPGGFVYLNGQNFFEIWEIFCYYSMEYIMYLFWLAPLLFLQCPRFSDLIFWWSH